MNPQFQKYLRMGLKIVLMTVFLIYSGAHAQEIRSIENDLNEKPPVVDSTKGPHKYFYNVFDSITNTQVKKEKDVVDWCSSNDEKQKAWVFRTDSQGKAVFWRDVNGIHVFDTKTRIVKTPIDLSYRRNERLGGPIITPDTTGSFLYVHWTDEIKENDKLMKSYSYYAFLNKDGEILWKKINVVDWSRPRQAPKKEKFYSSKTRQKLGENSCLETIWPSCNGDMLAILNLDCEPEVVVPKAEVWNSKGELIAELPGTFDNSYWSEDGKKIYLMEYKQNEKSPEYKMAVFSRDGKLLNLK